ncbi:hypothetical protein EAG18_03535 [Pseudoalteromonas sp. J010]|nr:hypothetical protein EAG18_03535 [Pseudoalteromonas sp. J010]
MHPHRQGKARQKFCCLVALNKKFLASDLLLQIEQVLSLIGIKYISCIAQKQKPSRSWVLKRGA